MTQFSIYDDIRKIPLEVDVFLESEPAINNIALGIFSRIRTNPESFANYKIFIISDKDQVCAYAHHIQPYPVILANASPEASLSLAQSLREQNQSVPAVHGLTHVVDSFMKGWPELVSRELKRETQGLYRLDQVIPAPKTAAVFGLANLDDLPLLMEWHNAFCRETGDFRMSEAALQNLIQSRIEARDLFLLRLDARPVSMASITRKIKEGRVISFIYTPPEDRGHGYAAELTATLSALCLENGHRFCCLFTQMENPISNKIYQKVGYQWVDEFLLVKFTQHP